MNLPKTQKKCAICGELFLPEKPSTRICHRDHFANCPVCGKQMLWNSRQAVPPCSKECRKEQTRRNNLIKYGVEHPMQSKEVQAHHRQAMLDKYGVESPLQSQTIKNKAIETNREKFGTDWALGSKEVHDKIRETMTERYGGPTTWQSPMLRQKAEQTCIEKYGAANPMQSDKIRTKVSNTNFLRYGVPNAAQNKEIYSKIKATRIANNGAYWTPEIQKKIRDVMIEKYGENYGLYLQRNVSEIHVVSNINKTFMAKLNEVGLQGEFEFTGIKNYRYDIAIPSRRILIEVDPSYTHNTIGNHWSDIGLHPNYHRDKSRAATEAGYRCIHVFDWDDWNKIITSLKEEKRIYARKCELYKLQPKVADKFLNENHLQGTVKGQMLCLGLVYENELVQVMTFGQPRYNKNYYSELLRLATKSGYSVIGGASKLFKFATDKLGVENIISYCDLAKFNGDVYERIGMTLHHITEPQEIWSKNDRKITANLLRQRGYDQLFNTNYGKGTSNDELMLADGWLPVYDCGQAVYTF